MRRNLNQLANHFFDLLIIGAGIHGAAIAWDATLRGLSVAIVEKDDFGCATSANSLKIVHGGLRYLQHADFKRMRESIRERNTLMRIAPHLVHPLPCLMPVYGHLRNGREMMALALLLNDMVGFDRNRGIEPRRRLPRSRTISHSECQRLLPGLPAHGLTGGAIWYDCQMYNAERLTLAFIMSAARRGAVVANYVKATGFLRQKDRIAGIHALDSLTGCTLDIRAGTVVNAAGPWADQVSGNLSSRHRLGVRLAKAINIATRPLFSHYAVGLYSKYKGQDANTLFHKRSRLLFVTPWRGRSLIGTTYAAYNKSPDLFKVTDEDVAELLDEFNRAYPATNLTRADVRFIYGGLVPVSDAKTQQGAVHRAKHDRMTDHREQGLKGLISLMGVKYTTARNVAEKVVDRVFAMKGRKSPVATSSIMLLHGGDVGALHDYLRQASAKQPCDLGVHLLRPLIYNYGTAYRDVLRYFERQPAMGRILSDEEALLAAETRHAVRHEMAQNISDVVLRRTEIGTGGPPDPEMLRLVARITGQELGWDQTRINAEYEAMNGWFALRT